MHRVSNGQSPRYTIRSLIKVTTSSINDCASSDYKFGKKMQSSREIYLFSLASLITYQLYVSELDL